MSCHQASRRTFVDSNNIVKVPIDAKNNCDEYKNAHQSPTDDPYVFSESSSTVPPAFFNIQKSRSRLTEVNSSATPAVYQFGTNHLHHQHKFPTAAQYLQQKKSSVIFVDNNTKIRVNSPVALPKDVSGNNTNPNTNITASTLNVSREEYEQLKQHSPVQLQNGIKKLTNVCIVRPQKQQQSSPSVESSVCEEIKSAVGVGVSSIYTPTPSLWQTPLLLEPINSPSHPSQRITVPNLISSTISQTPYSNSGSTGYGNSSTIATTITAMAKVAPIVVHTVAPTKGANIPTKLPPSNFHQRTTAQQLKKVEILKKSNTQSIPPPPPPPPPPPLQILTADSKLQHSNNNQKNYNVIFQMSMAPERNICETLKSDNKLSSSVSSESCSTASQYFEKQHNNNNNKNAPALVDDTVNDGKMEWKKSNNNSNNNCTVSSIRCMDQNEINDSVLLVDQKTQLASTIESGGNKVKTSQLDNVKQIEMSNNNKVNINASSSTQKRIRKTTVNIDYPDWQVSSSIKRAVAVVKMSQNDVRNDISLMASASCLPYCLQRNWLSDYLRIETPSPATPTAVNREKRILKHKNQLLHQAEQLLSIKSLQKLPLQLAKKRLFSVKRLLCKYNQQKKQYECKSLNTKKRCSISSCDRWCIEMSSYCQKHIVQNITQQIFAPCVAKFINNDQCKNPAFNVTHHLPLCVKHSRGQTELNAQFETQEKSRGILSATVLMSQPPQITQSKNLHNQLLCMNGSSTATTTTATRKRKLNTLKSVEKPKKRVRRTEAATVSANDRDLKNIQELMSLPGGMPAALQRKNSTTSLESINSNSHQSSSFSSIANYAQTAINHTKQMLAPVSGILSICGTDTTGLHFNNNLPPLNLLNIDVNPSQKHSQGYETNNLKDQITLISHNHEQPQQMQQRKHDNQYNFICNASSNSNYTSSGMGSTTSLPNEDEFFTQDLLNICESSSDSSTDTGLGGFSDPEFMLNATTDADDIPLGSTRLLEEHDLDNVLSSLPEDTFTELFATVRQDESDEIERAIEIADKNLKTLQQTIGSGLGDMLYFSDDILADTNGFDNDTTNCVPGLLDASSLFMDNNVNFNARNGGGNNLPEFPGLVQI